MLLIGFHIMFVGQLMICPAMSDPVCYIDKLPDHLLIKIFGNLVSFPANPHPGDFFIFSSELSQILLKRVRLVNRRWNEFAFSPQLWRRFARNFNYPRTFFPESRPCFQRIAPAIENLQVHFNSDLFPDGFFTKFPPLPNVKRLWAGSYPQLTPAIADSMVKFCPNVTSAKFSCPNSIDGYLQLFASGWEKLAELDVSACHVTTAGLIDFISAVANPLQSININEIHNLTDSDVSEITVALGNSLKSISLGSNQKNLSSLAISAIVRNCPLLEEICIHKPMYIGDLKDLTSLRKLTLDPLDDDPDVVDGLADCFCRPFAHLRYLKMENCSNLSDSIVNLIAISCPSLEHLVFLCSRGGNRAVTDAGMSEIFAKCRSLTVLVLTGFSSLTGQSFIGGRQTLPRLRFLHFRRSENVDMGVIETEFTGATGLKVYLNGMEILNI